MLELVSQPEKVSRPLVAPPRTPPDRIAELRAAFSVMLRDQDFQGRDERMQIGLEPLEGEVLQDFVFTVVRK
jgi:tripartite-type tricarboxylate transporter receptor subunit TctC